MSYFQGDSYSQIVLDTGISLTGASSTRILYTKPSGLKGYWTATPSGTTLIYQLVDGDINEAGIWSVQAEVVIGGKTAYGDISEIHFQKSLKR